MGAVIAVAERAPARGRPGICSPVEAIDRSGLAVTREGAFVRMLQVSPPNPLILTARSAPASRTATASSCRGCAPTSGCSSMCTPGR